MGWTETFNVNGSTKEYFDNSYNANCEVLKSKTVKNCYYGAVRIKDENRVVAVVIPFKRNNLNGSLLYKSMDESFGPVESNCPKSILKLLTPTESKYANEWRKRCYENLEKINVSKLEVGTIFKTENKIPFTSGEYDTFAVIRLWGKREYVAINGRYITRITRSSALNLNVHEVIRVEESLTNLNSFCNYLREPLV